MRKNLRVLNLEDNPCDAELNKKMLAGDGIECELTRVETRDDFLAALDRKCFDIILADYSLPSFDGLSALDVSVGRCPDVPFIFVSGTLAEDTAIEALKSGATDCVHKDRLSRLGPAVRRALKEKEERDELKRTEKALRELAAFQQQLIDALPVPVFYKDTEGRYLGCNRAFERFLMRSGDEIIGKSVYEISPPELAAAYDRMDQSLFRNPGGQVYEQSVQNAEGIVHDVVFHKATFPIPDGSVGGLIGAVIDISERKRIENALRASEEMFRLVVENAPYAIHVQTRGLFAYVNPAAMKLLEATFPDQLLGRSVFDTLHPAYHEEVRQRIHRANVERKPSPITEQKLISLKGVVIDVEILTVPITYENENGALVFIHDIRERKRAEEERERLGAKLRQSAKLESIGTLAGGIAHDFNNILSAISGYTELALHKLDGESPVRRYMQRVLDASSRATDLVKQILTFSRKTEQERKPVKLSVTVGETLKLLRPSLPTTIEIRRDISVPAQGAEVLADPTEMHQVLMNLCTNAAHAMRDQGGTLTVRLSDTIVDPFHAWRHPDLQTGRYVCLSVSDTGHGMDETVIERIFDPYFTTKGIGEGTGLGLAVVQGIVRGCGGAITVNSKPGQGTTFNVLLPNMEDQTVPQASPKATLPTGSERILLVDDEIVLADLGKGLVESLGYSVTALTNSLEALDVFRSEPDSFDLVITDMTMPGLTGQDLAKKLLAIRPDVPIILCTGFSDLINEKQAKKEGISEYVMKPYRINTIADAIRRALGPPGDFP